MKQSVKRSGSKPFAKVVSRSDDNSGLVLTLYLLVLSADNLCKQYEPRLGLTRLQDYLNLGLVRRKDNF